MSNNILNIGEEPYNDGSIIQKQWHTYSPFTSTFGNNDEIRIAIQSQDLYVQPADSYLLIEFEISHKPNVKDLPGSVAHFGTLTLPFLFNEIRYEINGIEIDRSKNVGWTTTMKRLAATRLSDKSRLDLIGAYNNHVLAGKKYQIIIPLNIVLGFAEDYNKIILNAKHELVLVRSRSDDNIYCCQFTNVNFIDFKLNKIQWKVPHITLSDRSKLKMLKYLERQRSITVTYRTWDLYEMPALPQTNHHIWAVKTTTNANKPRFVIVGLQTNRKDNFLADVGIYDHCNISDLKLFLNTTCYPYDNMNLDFARNQYMEAHLALNNVQESYYNGTEAYNPYALSYATFKDYVLFAFDCSRSDDSLLNGSSIDVRIEITSRGNIPANTAAYCLIIRDSSFDYSPFHGIVNKHT